MSTERAEAGAVDAEADDAGVSDHTRGIAVTALAALSGVLAALVSERVAAGEAVARATSTEPLVVLVAAVAVQPALLRALGLLKEDFGKKDMLYLAFITVALWFLAWGVLLTGGAGAEAAAGS